MVPCVCSVKGSLSNHDDDGNTNATNVQTIVLHALHVHFSFFDISQLFSRSFHVVK